MRTVQESPLPVVEVHDRFVVRIRETDWDKYSVEGEVEGVG